MLGRWKSICFLLLCWRLLGTFYSPSEVFDKFFYRMYKLQDIFISCGNWDILHAVIELNFAVNLSHDNLKCSTGNLQERG